MIDYLKATKWVILKVVREKIYYQPKNCGFGNWNFTGKTV